MLRVEIIANQSVEDDIIERIETELPDLEYTILPGVHGKGKSSHKLGNNIWPEENFLLFTYTDEGTAAKIKEIVTAVKTRFPREGISIFGTPAIDL